jgi:cytochrome c peroxidase
MQSGFVRILSGRSSSFVGARLVSRRNASHQEFVVPPLTPSSSSYWAKLLVAGAAGALVLYASSQKDAYADEKKAAVVGGAVDYAAVRKDIEGLLEDPKYDDGSYGPLFIRLAWHAAGTFDKKDGSGGSSGATMRFLSESGHGANAGLAIARERLEKVKAKYPGLSYADLWTLAGCVAIESMGGPKIAWRPGRTDHAGPKSPVPDGRLPDASQGQGHVRDVFYRMGFNDQEIVALIGAHAVGRCHTDRSGYEGPWTNSPTTISNDFYVQLLGKKWTERKWNGPKQYEDESKKLMMTPADLAFIQDPELKKWVVKYAADEDLWLSDFAKAFNKLIELGIKFPTASASPAGGIGASKGAKKEESKPWYKFW